MAKTDFKSVSEYIASKRKDVQAVLKLVRDAIRKAVPEAEELISYQMPMYRLNGGPVLYFAGWKQHYSLYPLGDAVAAEFQKELAAYEMSRGTIRLPLSEPVPVKLIQRIAKFRAKQLTARQKAKGSRKKGHETQLERVRRICGTMPGVSEKLSHGSPTFFVQKDKGVFTIFRENHYGDGPVTVWLPAPAGLQSALIGDAPEMYFKPPYVGSSGWIGIVLDQIRDEALEVHIREAWEISARKSRVSDSRKSPRRRR